jgi:hypothetical protein
VARGARTRKDVSARADSDRCCFPPFSARQLRRNHFAAAISVAPSGRLPRSLCRSRGRPASSDDPPVARRPRNAITLSLAAPSAARNRQHRVIILELRFWIVSGLLTTRPESSDSRRTDEGFWKPGAVPPYLDRLPSRVNSQIKCRVFAQRTFANLGDWSPRENP